MKPIIFNRSLSLKGVARRRPWLPGVLLGFEAGTNFCTVIPARCDEGGICVSGNAVA